MHSHTPLLPFYLQKHIKGDKLFPLLSWLFLSLWYSSKKKKINYNAKMSNHVGRVFEVQVIYLPNHSTEPRYQYPSD
jgi:hypothetical protein